jgi:hypothetical protein
MKYLLETRGDDFFGILNDNSDCCVGYVALRGARYHVQNVENEEIAIVKLIDEAIPALATYYDKHPPRWKRETATRYGKLTHFGLLRVEQDQPGQWLAYRDDCPLLRNGQPAIFAISEEAQRAADAHVPEGYPHFETIYDGFAWFPDTDPWWSYPHRIAVRAKWAASRG